MLVCCPECGKEISEKAIDCPNCGYPMKGSQVSIKRRAPKRMRLPNGFGQITEIKGRNLRNPFRAMISVGKNEEGKPITKLLKPVAYFKTYSDAYKALYEYNKNPYTQSAMTMSELYAEWSKTSSNKLESAWKYAESLYDMDVSSLRIRHFKKCIDEAQRVKYGKLSKATNSTKASMKTLFNNLMDYAVEYELTDRNYARMFSLDLKKEEPQKFDDDIESHNPYEDWEITKLWRSLDKVPYVDVILFQCYSGWRPQELCEIKLNQIDLDKWFIRSGMKTDSGRNRLVPIHPIVRDIISKRYHDAKSKNNDYLFVRHDKPINLDYSALHRFYKSTINELKLHPYHKPHDGRKHFATIAKEYGVNEFAIKYIIGHRINDITERVYTKRTPEWLMSEILKIPDKK